MDTDQLAFCLKGVLVYRTGSKDVIAVIFHIILILELGQRRDKHHIREFVIQQREDGLAFKNKVRFKQQETVIAYHVTRIVQSVHTVSIGITGTETGLYLGKSA